MPSDIISLTEFKAHASEWVERLQTQPPVVLTQNGKGRVVVQSYEEYQRLRFEAALVARVNRALSDVREGRTTPHEKVMADLKARLQQRLDRGD